MIFAVFLSIANNRTDAIDNLRFHLGLYNEVKEGKEISEAIRQFNKNSASFYNSAGFLAGLEEIPATPLLKRRLFKDISMLKRDGLVMVFDRDSVVIKRYYFKNRYYAIAEAVEVWAISLQDVKTREPLFNLKASQVKTRYQMYKDKGRWIIFEVDVYPVNEEIPPLDLKRPL